MSESLEVLSTHICEVCMKHERLKLKILRYIAAPM